MRVDCQCKCPNCKKPIDVVYDFNLPNGGINWLGAPARGDWLLMNRTCWNCGVQYTKLFKDGVGLPAVPEKYAGC